MHKLKSNGYARRHDSRFGDSGFLKSDGKRLDHGVRISGRPNYQSIEEMREIELRNSFRRTGNVCIQRDFVDDLRDPANLFCLTACGELGVLTSVMGSGQVLFGSPTTTALYTQGGRESSFWPALTYDAAARASLALSSRTR